MNLFLDTSVVLAACHSSKGASRLICAMASANDWALIVTPYVLDEVDRNRSSLAASGIEFFNSLRPKLDVRLDVFTSDRPTVFASAKDRPILFGALAWADVLLTLDRGDFGTLIGDHFYGLQISKPGTFISQERAAGRLR